MVFLEVPLTGFLRIYRIKANASFDFNLVNPVLILLILSMVFAFQKNVPPTGEDGEPNCLRGMRPAR